MTTEAVAELLVNLQRLAELVRPVGCKRLGGPFLKHDLCLFSMFSKDADGLLEPTFYVADEGGARGHGICLSYTTSKAKAITAARKILGRLSADEMAQAIAGGLAMREAEWKEQCRLRDEEWQRERAARVVKPPEKTLPRRRVRIFNKCGGKCFYCGTALELTGRWHIEHKMPRALMGNNADDNLAASCVPCNMTKRDKTDKEFIAELESLEAA